PGAAQDQHRPAHQRQAGGQDPALPVHLRRLILTMLPLVRGDMPLNARLTILFVLLCLPFVASAAELKIGFLDAERINRESAPAIRASKELEREFAPRMKELQKMESELKEAQATLEKEAMTMGESERMRREQELLRMNREFQRAQREYREDL